MFMFPAAVLSMFMLSFIFVMARGLLGGTQSVQVYIVCLCIVVRDPVIKMRGLTFH
jgi:hypothetical protein